jgi:hypothetical protein
VSYGLPIGSTLQPGNVHEYERIESLRVKIHEYREKYAGQPWIPAYLVGDAHFDNERTHRVLEEQFGIHAVFPHATDPGTKFAYWDNLGTPNCAAYGSMKLIQSQYFVDSAQRVKVGLRPASGPICAKQGFAGAAKNATSRAQPVGTMDLAFTRTFRFVVSTRLASRCVARSCADETRLNL